MTLILALLLVSRGDTVLAQGLATPEGYLARLEAEEADEDDWVFKSKDAYRLTANRLVILSDGGGSVNRYRDFIKTLTNHEVMILGKCNSSCTMFLALPKVCLGPDAILGFHRPKANDGKISTVNRLIQRIGSHYPAAVERLWRARWSTSRDLTYLSVSELRALAPLVPLCRD